LLTCSGHMLSTAWPFIVILYSEKKRAPWSQDRGFVGRLYF